MIYKRIVIRKILEIIFSFAVIQSLFFYAGSLLGESVKDIISNYDHWIAFALLCIIGGKMIYENFSETGSDKKDGLKTVSILALGAATSIDAVIVGLSLALSDVSPQVISLYVLTIFLVTSIASVGGIYIGKKTGRRVGRKAGIVGGVVIIMIGVRVLCEHTL